MAWVRCAGGGGKPSTFTDTFTVPHSTTTARTIGVSPKNGVVHISIRCDFASATSLNSSSFNDNTVTIGNTVYTLWNYRTSTPSSPVTFIEFDIRVPISNNDTISVSFKNPSSAVDRTFTLTAEII